MKVKDIAPSKKTPVASSSDDELDSLSDIKEDDQTTKNQDTITPNK